MCVYHILKLFKSRSEPKRKMQEKTMEKVIGECSICLQEMTTHSITALPCAHIFHTSCIQKWLQHHSTCPICENFVFR